MWRDLAATLGRKGTRALLSTWRVQLLERQHGVLASERGEALLYAFFHASRWGLLAYPAPMPVVQMVAPFPDFDTKAERLRRLGFFVVRGSKGVNGRAALYEMIEHVLAGANAALCVDGPFGPAGVAKRGIVELARDTEGAILPLGVGYSNAVETAGWDHAQVPLPFSRVVILEGEPLYVEPESDDLMLETMRERVQQRLRALNERAQALADEPEKPHA